MSEQRRIPIETDPLGAIRKELVLAARRQKAVREQRRRLAIVAATIVAALASLACASAITEIRTGIPAIDRILGNQERNPERIAAGAPAHRPSSRLNATPKVEASALSIEVPGREGATEAVGSLYLSESGRVCFALAQPSEPGGGVVRGGQRDCRHPPVLSRRLAEQRVFVAGFAFGEFTIVHGYAAPEVEAVRMTGPNGALRMRLSAAWRPEWPGADALRLFMGYRPATTSQGDGWSKAAPAAGDPRAYEVRARLGDGRILERPALGRQFRAGG